MRWPRASLRLALAGLLAVSAARAPSLRGEPVPRLAARPASARWRLLDLFTPAGGPVAPGEPPRGLGGSHPGDCASCHPEIAAEWAASGHARAWTDPIFQAEYRQSPEPFCRHCHAPLAPAMPATPAMPAIPAMPALPATTQAPRASRFSLFRAPWAGDWPDLASAALAGRGVDCAVCHVREGRVLGVHGRGDSDHAARRDARLATSAFCGSCHQFDFPAALPDRPIRYHPGAPLQNTAAEWAQSRYADRPCQRCHMPVVPTASTDPAAPRRTHLSHAFAVFEDPDRLARALRITTRARRRGAVVRVAITLEGAELGHAFPTGDMFRQAVLTVTAGAARDQEILRRYFAQTITADGRHHLLGQVEDTRVPAPGAGAPLQLTFELPEPTATEVSWTLELFRLDPIDAARRRLDPTSIKILVQSGRLPISGGRPRHPAPASP